MTPSNNIDEPFPVTTQDWIEWNGGTHLVLMVAEDATYIKTYIDGVLVSKDPE